MRLFILSFTLLLASCGHRNLAEDRVKLTPDQKARAFMNDGEYQKAIDILQPLVDAKPQEYSRMPLLSAAYAGLAGVGILDILLAQFSGDGGDTVFDQIDKFLPEDYDRDEVEIVENAVATLSRIPSEKRGVEGDPDYGESAELQLILYQAVYATMYLNLFVSVIDGELDLDALAEMSEEDAIAIVEALLDAAGNTGGANGGISEAAQRTLDEIDATDGSSDRERLRNFIQSRHQ